MDYSRIKQEFKNANVKFPLREEECVGLTKEEGLIINPCGTYCGSCEDYGVVCDGCRNRKGRPIWYDLYGKTETCIYYVCTQEKKCHDCSQCDQVPCKEYFQYPDPNMTDDFKQYWFQLRMKNFNQKNEKLQLEIKETFKENEEKYKK